MPVARASTPSTAAVVVLEDCPLFNAGRGAVFNSAGEHELDAAVMDGSSLRAGAVAGVRATRNPVLAARAVMEKTRHVLLCGDGADRFAAEVGLAVVPHDYYSTEARHLALKRVQRTDREKARCRLGRRPARNCRRGCTGCCRQSRGGDLDGRIHEQDAGARGRLAGDRSRHLRRTTRRARCQGPALANTSCARCLRTPSARGCVISMNRLPLPSRNALREVAETGRHGRARRGRSSGPHRDALQHRRHVSRIREHRREAGRADLRRLIRRAVSRPGHRDLRRLIRRAVSRPGSDLRQVIRPAASRQGRALDPRAMRAPAILSSAETPD